MAKLNEEKLKKLEEMRALCLHILNFIGKVTPPFQVSYHEEFEEIVKATFTRKNLRGMMYIKKDVIEWAEGMNKQQLEELNNSLRLKFNKDLSELKKRNKREP